MLLSRVIQAWQEIHDTNGTPISERMFWGSVYSLSLGVNFGAFGISLSASLTGVMWRRALMEEKIRVSGMEFWRVCLPIIAFSMIIACTVLVGETYIIRDNSPYRP
jgi:Na+/H+ antiporter NhaD/arsenite permease-like protein